MKELSIEEKAQRYDEALEKAKKLYEQGTITESLGHVFPELKESEDERIRKDIMVLVKDWWDRVNKDNISTKEQMISWLEKQGESYTKKDIDDAYLKGISDAKDELEKQGTPAKLSEEEQNSFAKGVLSNCALSFINYLDAHSYEGKMCVSNGECEDIDYAFHNAMWDRLHRYYCKYIEKQDEQKPILDFKASNFYVSKVDGKIHDMTYNSTDRAKPKFKVGDWLASNICNSSDLLHIIDVDNKNYEIETPQGNTGVPSIAYIDNNFHLWTIQDAKDGDVLVDKYGNIGIYQGDKNTVTWNSYCYCGVNKVFYDEGSHEFPCYPATKEQRDLLFQNMKEAGYEWNAEKKELNKIEDEIEIPFGAKDSELQEETYYIPKGFHAEIDDDKVVIKKGEKPAEWSDEDEHRVEDTIYFLDTAKKHYASTIELDACIDWLKSLKKRIGG